MTVRYPRCWLSIAGVMVPCIDATVDRKAQRASDAFTATFASKAAAQLGLDEAFWADLEPQPASIIMASTLGQGDQRTMITGDIDIPEIHWLENQIVVHSRDKSASLTEKKRNQKFANQSSSDQVKQIAQDHGLQASVVNSGDFCGQVYDTDVANLAINRSDWEVLDNLADREGYRWYVDGDTLYFEPDDASGSFQIVYRPPTDGNYASGNLMQLITGRNLTAARPHEVTVKSWHHKDGKVYQSKRSMSGTGNVVQIEHHHTGRNQEQVDKLAASRLKNATRHDMSVHVEMPGDLSCDVRQTLSLSGTGTVYDQTYQIDRVEFVMGWDKGFEMTVEAKSAKAGRTTS